jgi:hypothetical protein
MLWTCECGSVLSLTVKGSDRAVSVCESPLLLGACHNENRLFLCAPYPPQEQQPVRRTVPHNTGSDSSQNANTDARSADRNISNSETLDGCGSSHSRMLVVATSVRTNKKKRASWYRFRQHVLISELSLPVMGESVAEPRVSRGVSMMNDTNECRQWRHGRRKSRPNPLGKYKHQQRATMVTTRGSSTCRPTALCKDDAVRRR